MPFPQESARWFLGVRACGGHVHSRDLLRGGSRAFPTPRKLNSKSFLDPEKTKKRPPKKSDRTAKPVIFGFSGVGGALFFALFCSFLTSENQKRDPPKNPTVPNPPGILRWRHEGLAGSSMPFFVVGVLGYGLICFTVLGIVAIAQTQDSSTRT